MSNIQTKYSLRIETFPFLIPLILYQESDCLYLMITPNTQCADFSFRSNSQDHNYTTVLINPI